MDHPCNYSATFNNPCVTQKKNPYHHVAFAWQQLSNIPHVSFLLLRVPLDEGREIVWIQWHADQIDQIAHVLSYYGWL